MTYFRTWNCSRFPYFIRRREHGNIKQHCLWRLISFQWQSTKSGEGLFPPCSEWKGQPMFTNECIHSLMRAEALKHLVSYERVLGGNLHCFSSFVPNENYWSMTPCEGEVCGEKINGFLMRVSHRCENSFILRQGMGFYAKTMFSFVERLPYAGRFYADNKLRKHKILNSAVTMLEPGVHNLILQGSRRSFGAMSFHPKSLLDYLSW